MPASARAFWVESPGEGGSAPSTWPTRPRRGRWCGRCSPGISRGTEALVFRGGVPESQRQAMRAPYQEGDFPGPVKYGYLNVGVVESGPAELVGRTVFCLYPHQTRYVVPAAAVTVVPDGVPAAAGRPGGHGRDGRQRAVGRRAAARRPGRGGRGPAWSAPASPGCSPASPASTVTLVDPNPARAALATALGVGVRRGRRTHRASSTWSWHASATAAGLQLALDLLAPEGTVVDLSWYGDAPGHAVARRGVPRPAADHPVQPGRRGRAGASGQPDDEGSAGAGAGPVAGQRL